MSEPQFGISNGKNGPEWTGNSAKEDTKEYKEQYQQYQQLRQQYQQNMDKYAAWYGDGVHFNGDAPGTDWVGGTGKSYNEAQKDRQEKQSAEGQRQNGDADHSGASATPDKKSEKHALPPAARQGHRSHHRSLSADHARLTHELQELSVIEKDIKAGKATPEEIRREKEILIDLSLSHAKADGKRGHETASRAHAAQHHRHGPHM